MLFRSPFPAAASTASGPRVCRSSDPRSAKPKSFALRTPLNKPAVPRSSDSQRPSWKLALAQTTAPKNVAAKEEISRTICGRKSARWFPFTSESENPATHAAQAAIWFDANCVGKVCAMDAHHIPECEEIAAELLKLVTSAENW